MRSKRYETLDALRGVAAFIVVWYHLGQLKLEPEIFVHGYLAVDFFFILSGFVIAFAYERDLMTGLTWQAFGLKRLIRLYPLALMGALLGFAVMLMRWYSVPAKVEPLGLIVTSGVFNSLLLPILENGKELFPINGPLWSLFFELLANMLWAVVGIRRKTWELAAASAISWVALTAFASHYHTLNIGYQGDMIEAGVARVCFGFPLGIVIFRLLDRGLSPVVQALQARCSSTAWGGVLLSLILALALACPVDAEKTGTAIYDLACILLILPAIVLIGIAQPAMGALGRILGDLSYPVYVLHYPMLLVAAAVQTRLPNVSPHAISAVSVGMVVVFSWLALRLYDEPVRRFLSSVTAKNRRRPAVPV